MAFAGQISLPVAQVASLFFLFFFSFLFLPPSLPMSGSASLEQGGRAASEPRSRQPEKRMKERERARERRR